MDVAALVAWSSTALAGLVLLSTWLVRGGLRRGGVSTSQFSPSIVVAHVGLAVIGLALWVTYVAGAGSAVTWPAFLVLLVAGVFGLVLFGKWLPQTPDGASPTPEAYLRGSIVLLHGLLATVTVIVVLIAALQA